MKLRLLFIGNKFIYNAALKEYILRKIGEKFKFIHSITHFKESDNALFLYLEQELNEANELIIITTKSNFSTIGKLLCTVTTDNQILKDGMLIPSNASVYEDSSYLLDYKSSITNVISMDEMRQMPQILLNNTDNIVTINLFEEERESAIAILSPIAKTHDVSLQVVTIVQGWLQIVIESKKYGNISNFIESAKKLFSKKLICKENIIAHIIEVLAQNNMKVSFAESCTGGLLSYYFTSVNGASQILDGSLITYSNELKDNWLGVDYNTIEMRGAVSAEVVEEMSEGAINVSHADFSLSISGVAGDTGGTKDKPVGTVYVGVRAKDVHKEEYLFVKGDRNYVQHQSALYAIKMLLLIDKEIFF